MPRPRTPLAERLWSRVAKAGPDDCWPFTGPLSRKGYGKISLGGAKGSIVGAHRVAYMLAVGPIPEGLDVLHTCDNPPCCNPRHLFVGTQADNIRDMIAKGRRGYTGLPGGRNHRALLTPFQVRIIRASPRTAYELADRYGVSHSHIRRIRRNASWKQSSK